MRDNQVPDASGRTIPVEAVSGQVLWSWVQQEEGETARSLIGRAEQASVGAGLASTYACANCCPDSFIGSFMSPESLSGFPGDQTLCDAMQQNENCYGTALDPFRVSGAYWWSDNTGVATIDGGGWATAQSEGSAWLRGRWPAFIYTDGGSSGCESGLLHPVVEALCDVLELRANRGRIQAQGSNPPVEVSVAWSQDNVPSKGDGQRWLDSVWDRLTASQQRDRRRAYEDAMRYIQNAPQDGYLAPISRRFQDPARRDPSARIDIEIITGRAFEGPF